MAWASERDRRAALRAWIKWTPVLLMVFSVLFLDAWLNVQKWQGDYALNTVNKEVETLKVRNYDLSLKIARYSDPAYLETLATEIGLSKPAPEQYRELFYDTDDLLSPVEAPIMYAGQKNNGVFDAWESLLNKSEQVSAKAFGYFLRDGKSASGVTETIAIDGVPGADEEEEAGPASPIAIAESESIVEEREIVAATSILETIAATAPETAPPIVAPSAAASAPSEAMVMPAVASAPVALEIPKEPVADRIDESVGELLGTL